MICTRLYDQLFSNSIYIHTAAGSRILMDVKGYRKQTLIFWSIKKGSLCWQEFANTGNWGVQVEKTQQNSHQSCPPPGRCKDHVPHGWGFRQHLSSAAQGALSQLQTLGISIYSDFFFPCPEVIQITNKGFYNISWHLMCWSASPL